MNFYETSLGNVIKPAFGELYNRHFRIECHKKAYIGMTASIRFFL